MAGVDGMSGNIERAREVLSDPDEAMSEKVSTVGFLAIGVVAGAWVGEEIEEARRIVLTFWQGLRGVA